MEAQVEQFALNGSRSRTFVPSRDASSLLQKLATGLDSSATAAAPSSDEKTSATNRDWSSAIDLVNETFESIKIGEERAASAEEYQKQLVAHHEEELRALESRLLKAEKRAEASERRAKEAEAWLNRFHDTIVDGFRKAFVSK